MEYFVSEIVVLEGMDLAVVLFQTSSEGEPFVETFRVRLGVYKGMEWNGMEWNGMIIKGMEWNDH